MMQSNIQRLRNYYTQFRNAAYNNEPKKITGEKFKSCKNIIAAQKNHINQTGQFGNLQQVSFYEQKFGDIAKLMRKAQAANYSKNKYLSQMKQILKEQKYSFGNSYLKKQKTPPQINQPPPLQNQMISEFFQSKKSKLAHEAGFKSLLQSAPVTHKAFKKKQNLQDIKQQTNVYQQQYNKIKNQNADLKRRLDELQQQKSKANYYSPSQPNQQYDIQKKRIQARLKILQLQNQSLYRQNNQLKSQKSVTQYNYNNFQNYDPYSISTRQNDLYKINIRNESQTCSRPNNYEQKMSDFIRQERDKNTYSQMGNSKIRDSFDMSQSMTIQRLGFFFGNKKYGVNDLRTATRNKVAFFKPKMIISKDDDFQIAFKRSSLQGNLDKIRIILYVNNKTQVGQNAKIKYQYETQYYDVDIKERINYIPANKQAREVLEIQLKPVQDLNQIIEVIFQIADKQYKLWIPILFIQFQQFQNTSNHFDKDIKKTIQANKQFSTIQKAKQLMPTMKIFMGEGQLWGKSKIYSGPIKLKWKQSNRLEVETSEKWIDLLTFILFDYRS